MRTGPAEPEPGDRHAIALELAGGAQEEHLIQRHLAMMPLAAGHAELALDILGRQHLLRDHAAGEIRGKVAEQGQRAFADLLARLVVRGRAQAIGCVLEQHRGDMLALGRQRRDRSRRG